MAGDRLDGAQAAVGDELPDAVCGKGHRVEAEEKLDNCAAELDQSAR